MKSNTHPENYRLVAFKDMSNNDVFITKSTVETKETVKIDGKEYPLFKLEISRTSHPYYHAWLPFGQTSVKVGSMFKFSIFIPFQILFETVARFFVATTPASASLGFSQLNTSPPGV